MNTDEKDNLQPPTKKTRSASKPFEWLSDCLFCGSVCDGKHESVCKVSTLELRKNILDVCHDHPAEADLADITFRVQNCIDLVAVDAVYHTECMTNFFLKHKKVNPEEPADEKRPLGYNSSFVSEERRTPGRPENSVTSEAFLKTCEWLESLTEPKSVAEFEEYMSKLVDEKDMCTRKWIKKKLEMKYGKSITFSSDGYRDIISLKDMTEQIINDRWYAEKKTDVTEEKYRIIKAAAKLIQTEIREMKFDKSHFSAAKILP